jgi:hypothetical protein
VTVVNSQQWLFFERHFAAPRLRHYLTECGGDEVLAMRLYKWNTELSAAFWESLGHVEVALRNTIDRQMSARHASRGRSGHWIFDDHRELGRDKNGSGKHAQPYFDISVAIERVRKNGKILDPGQIVSEMSFGFWHQMVSKQQRFLWPDLAGGFPNMPGRGQEAVTTLALSLREIGNRIGHHHRIWAIDVAAKYSDLLTLAGLIDTDLEQWIGANSRVSIVLARRP